MLGLDTPRVAGDEIGRIRRQPGRGGSQGIGLGNPLDHRLLLDRAWQLRETLRTWEALDVAMAEATQATLIARVDVSLAPQTIVSGSRPSDCDLMRNGSRWPAQLPA